MTAPHTVVQALSLFHYTPRCSTDRLGLFIYSPSVYRQILPVPLHPNCCTAAVPVPLQSPHCCLSPVTPHTIPVPLNSAYLYTHCPSPIALSIVVQTRSNYTPHCPLFRYTHIILQAVCPCPITPHTLLSGAFYCEQRWAVSHSPAVPQGSRRFPLPPRGRSGQPG